MKYYLLLLCAFGCTWAVNAQSFEELEGTTFPGVKNSAVAWCDYDLDGDLDFVLTGDDGIGSKTSRLYRNEGKGSFIHQKGTKLTEVEYSALAWCDYDADGDPDLLLAGDDGFFSRVTQIYQNKGKGVLSLCKNIGLIGMKDCSADWGDYDLDGDMDLLMTGDNGSGFYRTLYENKNEGAFTEKAGNTMTGVDEGTALWGDYDNDCDLDILMAGRSGNNPVSILYQNKDGRFAKKSIFTGIGYGSAAWCDYDNDGDLDILLAGENKLKKPVSIIYENNGSGGFAEKTDIHLTGMMHSYVAWGDYDNDGYADILITGFDGKRAKTLIYKNDREGHFTESGISLETLGWGRSAWGDYDNDGDLDILLTGYAAPGKAAIIYENKTNRANTAPSVPKNLKSQVKGGEVILMWDAATDIETPGKGLSYNLYIGSTPKSVDICPPMSDLNSGYRYIPSMGNLQTGKRHCLKKPPPGTYYWSVQAVDQGFMGGLFAPEQSFTIE